MHAATLACCTCSGIGVEQDRRKAAELFRFAALRGSDKGQYLLGLMYLTADGVPLNTREGARWITASAEQGNTLALFELAQLHEHGRGVMTSRHQAIKAYRHAAVKGHAGAQSNLAMLLLERNEPQDRAQAMVWLERAGAQGVAQAQYALGRLYAEPGKTQDERAAVWWLARAAEQDLPEALASLAVMYDHGRGTQADPVLAAQLYARAADRDWPRAQHMLGVFYEAGRGVEKDLPNAYRWYSLAAANGFEPAMAERDRLKFALPPEQQSRGGPADPRLVRRARNGRHRH